MFSNSLCHYINRFVLFFSGGFVRLYSKATILRSRLTFFTANYKVGLMQDFREEGSFATTFYVDLVVSLVRSIQVVLVVAPIARGSSRFLVLSIFSSTVGV